MVMHNENLQKYDIVFMIKMWTKVPIHLDEWPETLPFFIELNI